MCTAVSYVVVVPELRGVDCTTCAEISVRIYTRLSGFEDPESHWALYDYIDLRGF